ncbi:MAG: polyphosphate kinase, partial [Pseudohongiellaceae bacterium]
SIAAPTDEELAQHYLWRFWRHLPMAGYLTIYDRSWYGRVLVERVEQLAEPDDWQRGYAEINLFEQQLCEHGIIVLKFWLHLSPEEQLRRFKEREQTPWKQYKITQDDWRNRDRWNDYLEAVNDMVAHTSTTLAPWHLVPAEDKKYGRIDVLRTVCRTLKKALKQ